MAIYYHNDQVIRERLPKQVRNIFGVQLDIYDIDNLYPQRMEQIALKSPLVKSAIRVLTDFINGDGFEKGEDVVNQDGETVNDILDLVSSDMGTYQGFALLIDFNAMGGIEEVQYLPFPYVRYDTPDDQGRHMSVFVSNNWEGQSNGITPNLPNPKKYPLFNPLLAGTQVLTGGGTQVLYVTQKPDSYPLTSFDSVADAAQTDAALQEFELNTVSKGFSGVTLLHVPGGWEGKEEERAIKDQAMAMSGSRGGGIVAVQTDDESDQRLLETVPADNKDRLFDLTTTHVRDIITQNYNQPGALSGVNPEGGVFTQLAYQDAFAVYNSATKNIRNRVERAFKKVFNLWATGTMDIGKIIPQKFDTDEPEQPEAPVIPLETEEEPSKLEATYGINVR